jgi:hypothetical protein
MLCSRIDVDGSESRLLDSMKRIIDPTMTACSRLAGKPIESFTPSDFATVFLNRDWFLLLYDYINSRIEDEQQKSTMQEILEMQRVWILQCIYQTTATNLFENSSDWFYPVRRLHISLQRYSFLFNHLGADLPPIDIRTGPHDAKEDEKAEVVWGSFNQHNDVVSKSRRVKIDWHRWFHTRRLLRRRFIFDGHLPLSCLWRTKVAPLGLRQEWVI